MTIGFIGLGTMGASMAANLRAAGHPLLTLARKDVSVATALGRELGVPMRLANLVREEMTEALNRGWGHRDSRVAMLLQEERASVRIAVPPAKIRQALEQDA